MLIQSNATKTETISQNTSCFSLQTFYQTQVLYWESNKVTLVVTRYWLILLDFSFGGSVDE